VRNRRFTGLALSPLESVCDKSSKMGFLPHGVFVACKKKEFLEDGAWSLVPPGAGAGAVRVSPRDGEAATDAPARPARRAASEAEAFCPSRRREIRDKSALKRLGAVKDGAGAFSRVRRCGAERRARRFSGDSEAGRDGAVPGSGRGEILRCR